MTPNKQGATMKRKIRYALAALAIAAAPIVVADVRPASAMLAGCTGYTTSNSYNSICWSGSGLQRAWVKYRDDDFPGYVFWRYGVWAGLGQYSSASIGFYRQHMLSYGRNYSG